MGTAVAGAGVAMGTLSGAAVAITGVALVIAAPVVMWVAWHERRSVREHIIQKAMTDCLQQSGYSVSRWRRLTDGEMTASALATPTTPQQIQSGNPQDRAPSDAQSTDPEP